MTSLQQGVCSVQQAPPMFNFLSVKISLHVTKYRSQEKMEYMHRRKVNET
jgi:hypothetical protein